MSEETNATESSPKKAPRNYKPWLIRIGGAAAVLFVGIQFISLYEVEGLAEAKPGKWPESKEVEAILRRACYDCHSNEVKWPWYSKVAPMKWLVMRDVRLGRKAFNFSEWPEDEEDRQYNRESAWEIVDAGEMPPWFYTFPAHPEAKLSDKDLELLENWATENAE